MAARKVKVQEQVPEQLKFTQDVNMKSPQQVSTEETPKVKSKLVGCTIVLDPSISGMFMDPTTKITLGFMDGQTDRYTIKEGEDITVLQRNIKKGVLRVMKGEKDITAEMGGPKKSVNWCMEPIVTNAHKPVANEDTPLIGILNRNNQSELIKTIILLKNYKTLSRLRELEEMGKNPASQPRVDIINVISEEMKKCPSGISDAKVIKEDKSDVIHVR